MFIVVFFCGYLSHSFPYKTSLSYNIHNLILDPTKPFKAPKSKAKIGKGLIVSWRDIHSIIAKVKKTLSIMFYSNLAIIFVKFSFLFCGLFNTCQSKPLVSVILFRTCFAFSVFQLIVTWLLVGP